MREFLRRVADRIRGKFRPDPHVYGAVHCVNCGHEYVAVISAASPCYNPETGALDMLECSECGLFTVCSK